MQPSACMQAVLRASQWSLHALFHRSKTSIRLEFECRSPLSVGGRSLGHLETLHDDCCQLPGLRINVTCAIFPAINAELLSSGTSLCPKHPSLGGAAALTLPKIERIIRKRKWPYPKDPQRFGLPGFPIAFAVARPRSLLASAGLCLRAVRVRSELVLISSHFLTSDIGQQLDRVPTRQ